MAKKLIIYGAGDNGGRFAYDYREVGAYRSFDFVGFVDDVKTGMFVGFPILGTGKDLHRLKKDGLDHLIVFLLHDSVKRLAVCRAMAQQGFIFPSIFPSLPSSLLIGKGVLVHESACFLGFDGSVGDYTVIGPSVVIEGRTCIGEGVIIRPFSFIGYESTIGEGSVIGPRATVLQSVSVGKECVIGPHVLLHHSVEDGEKVLRY